MRTANATTAHVGITKYYRLSSRSYGGSLMVRIRPCDKDGSANQPTNRKLAAKVSAWPRSVADNQLNGFGLAGPVCMRIVSWWPQKEPASQCKSIYWRNLPSCSSGFRDVMRLCYFYNTSQVQNGYQLSLRNVVFHQLSDLRKLLQQNGGIVTRPTWLKMTIQYYSCYDILFAAMVADRQEAFRRPDWIMTVSQNPGMLPNI